MAKLKQRRITLWILFFLSACLLVILRNSHWLKQRKYPLVYEEQIQEYVST